MLASEFPEYSLYLKPLFGQFFMAEGLFQA